MAGVGVLGGTFDPVHSGHVALARDALHRLGLDSVHLIPNQIPPHRTAPKAGTEHRLAMVRCVCRDGLIADDRELRRPGPSYMVDTLRSLREELGMQVPLVLLMGFDAFLDLHHWYRWRTLFELAHVAVYGRTISATAGVAEPDSAEASDALESSEASGSFRNFELFTRRLANVPFVRQHGLPLAQGVDAPFGNVIVVPHTIGTVSATQIRAALRDGYDGGDDQRLLHELLPLAVSTYIRKHNLYLEDSSHTDPQD